MWFFAALFVVAFIAMVLLTPKIKTQNAVAASLDQFNFPRAKEGDPQTRFYGTCKLTSPNTIGLSGYRAVAIKVKQKTGIFSSKMVITGYKYYITAVLAWALGPGVVYRRFWFADNLVWVGDLYNSGNNNEMNPNFPEMYGGSDNGNRGGIGGNVQMYGGAFGQAPDSYLVAKVSPKMPGYTGVAYMVFRDFWFGNTAQIDAVSCEASYFVDGLGLAAECKHVMSNGLDANPIAVLYDILTYDWGNLGFATSKIDQAMWKAAAEQVWAENMGISLIVSGSTTGNDVFSTIQQQINAMVYENVTRGLVEIRLIRNDYVVADLPVLGVGDIIDITSYSKKLWSETNNIVRVKYTDRLDNYAADKVAQAKDSSLLRFQGHERPVEFSMPGIATADTANKVAARQLSNLNVPIFSAELEVNRTVTGFRPGDLFVWVWPEYTVVQMVMRIRKIALGTLEDGKITFSVVQDEFSLDSVVTAAPSPSQYVPTTAAALKITVAKLWELPNWLDAQTGLGTRPGYSRMAAFAVAPSSYTLGFYGYVEDEPEDATVLELAPYTPHARLSRDVSRFAGFTAGVIASVNIDTVVDTPDNPALIVDPATRDGGGMCLIGDELWAYESFTVGVGGAYALNNVHRALLDTGWFAHNIGETIYFINDQNDFFNGDTPNGETDDIYLLDKTSTGKSSKSDATILHFTNVGRVDRVIAPDYVTANASRAANQNFTAGDTVTLAARPRNRNDVGTIWYEDDAAGTAETGTTYKIMYVNQVDGIEHLIADAVALPYDWDTTGRADGIYTVHIYAKKDGLYSIVPAPFPLSIGETFLIADGDGLYADGDPITSDDSSVSGLESDGDRLVSDGDGLIS